jgi:methyl-accepting chemotaxis protein
MQQVSSAVQDVSELAQKVNTLFGTFEVSGEQKSSQPSSGKSQNVSRKKNPGIKGPGIKSLGIKSPGIR